MGLLVIGSVSLTSSRGFSYVALIYYISFLVSLPFSSTSTLTSSFSTNFATSFDSS